MTAHDETGSRDGYLFLNLLSASAARSCLGVGPSPEEPGEDGTHGELRPTSQLTAQLVLQNSRSRAEHCLGPFSSSVYRSSCPSAPGCYLQTFKSPSHYTRRTEPRQRLEYYYETCTKGGKPSRAPGAPKSNPGSQEKQQKSIQQQQQTCVYTRMVP